MIQLNRFVLVLSSMCLLEHSVVNGFASTHHTERPFTRLRPAAPRQQRLATPTALNSLRRDENALQFLIAKTTTSALAFPMFVASSVPFGSGAASSVLDAADPIMEAEVLNDLAHVSLDIMGLLGPATVLMRLSAVCGRLFAISADYVPDHTVLPGEIVFQCVMLAFAWLGLVKAAIPLAMSQFASGLSLRDGKAFAAIFAPTGMTWEQFKALSVYSLDWITVSPGQVIATQETNHNNTVNDDHIYWLFSGNMSVTSQGREIYKVSRQGRVGKPSDAAGLWNEGVLLQRSKSNKVSKKKNKKTAVQSQEQAAAFFPKTTIHATGDKEAILLRLNTPRVTQLMETDPKLAELLRTLVFQGMQAKLAAQLCVP